MVLSPFLTWSGLFRFWLWRKRQTPILTLVPSPHLPEKTPSIYNIGPSIWPLKHLLPSPFSYLWFPVCTGPTQSNLILSKNFPKFHSEGSKLPLALRYTFVTQGLYLLFVTLHLVVSYCCEHVSCLLGCGPLSYKRKLQTWHEVNTCTTEQILLVCPQDLESSFLIITNAPLHPPRCQP